MRNFAWICLPTICVLSGCAGVPTAPSIDGISVSQIVNAVQCEIADAYEAVQGNKKLVALLDKYTAGVKLELKVREQNTLGTGIKLVVPIAPIAFDSLTISAGANWDNTSYRYTTLTFDAALPDLRTKFLDKKGRAGERCLTSETGFSPAEGSLGLTEWIAESIKALGEPNDAAELDSTSYLIEFILVRDLKGGISFKSTRVQDANANAGSVKTRDNTLNIALTKIPGKPQPQRIVIVGYEAPTTTLVPRRITRKTAARTEQRTTPSKVSPETKARLQFLLQQNKLNSVISPNTQIVPY